MIPDGRKPKHTGQQGANMDYSKLRSLSALFAFAVVVFLLAAGCSNNVPGDTFDTLNDNAGNDVNGDSEIDWDEDINWDDDTWSPGAGWNLVWSDEFDSGFDSNTWAREVLMNPYNDEWQVYPGGDSTDNAWVENGKMIIKAEWNGTTHAPGNYTSARVISNPGGTDGTSSADGKTFRYGKIAARIRLPYGKGIWPAFWMLGDNISETGGDTDWPASGEIDILETGNRNDPDYGQRHVSGTIHYENADGGHSYATPRKMNLPEGQKFADSFHVFEIEWDNQQILWKVDGVQMGTPVDITPHYRSEFHKPFYVIFNIAVGGHFTHDPDHSTPFPQYMFIDWIRHYEKE